MNRIDENYAGTGMNFRISTVDYVDPESRLFAVANTPNEADRLTTEQAIQRMKSAMHWGDFPSGDRTWTKATLEWRDSAGELEQRILIEWINPTDPERVTMAVGRLTFEAHGGPERASDHDHRQP